MGGFHAASFIPAASSVPLSRLEAHQQLRHSSTLTPPPGRLGVLPSPILRHHYGSKEMDKVHAPFGAGMAPSKTVRDWETLVIFAVNLSRLDVMVNMSNVMGNTVYVCHIVS